MINCIRVVDVYRCKNRILFVCDPKTLVLNIRHLTHQRRYHMKDTTSLHLKVQELCDCFATTDPLKEMSKLAKSKDTDEDALKWIALAVLHGINNNAKEISLSATDDGSIEVSAKYRSTQLPSPGPEIGKKVINAVREITHIEKDKGKTALALGFRNNDLNLKIKTKNSKKGSVVEIHFP